MKKNILKALFTILIGLTFIQIAIGQTKPEPFEVEHIVWKGKEYAFIRSIKPNMGEAKKECALLKMELVKIESQEENDFITTHAFAKNGVKKEDGLQYWLGASDTLEEGKWLWIRDKSHFFDEKTKTNKNNSYTNWGKTTLGGQPNNVIKNDEDEDCVVIRNDGSWYDIGCTKRYAYVICSKKSRNLNAKL